MCNKLGRAHSGGEPLPIHPAVLLQNETCRARPGNACNVIFRVGLGNTPYLRILLFWSGATFHVFVMQPVLSKAMVMRRVRAALRELGLTMTNDRRVTVDYYIAYVG